MLVDVFPEERIVLRRNGRVNCSPGDSHGVLLASGLRSGRLRRPIEAPCLITVFTVDSPMCPHLIIVKWIALKPFPVMERNAFGTNCKVGLAHCL